MVDFNPTTDLPSGSLSGKVYVVTGGNTGLGLASVRALARAGGKVYLAARGEEKATAAIANIKSEIPDADVVYLHLDLTQPKSIIGAARRLQEADVRLDGLLNNAGIMMTPYETVAWPSDSSPSIAPLHIESHLSTNALSHHLLTRLLLPLLHPHARIVNVSSAAHNFAFRGIPPLSPDDVREAHLRSATKAERYGISKLAMIFHAQELSRREGVTAVAVHPGVVVTGLYRPFGESWWGGWVVGGVRRIWGGGTEGGEEEFGARNQVWALTAKDVEPGQYYVPVGEKGGWWGFGRVSGFVGDREMANRVWEWAEEVVKGVLEREGVKAKGR